MKRIINIIIYILTLVSSCFFLYFVTKVNLFNTGILIGIYGVTIISMLILLYLLVIRKIKIVTNIIVVLLCMLIIGFNIVACKYTINTINYITKITNIKYETAKYNVLVLNDSNYNEIGDLKGKKLGFISFDDNKKKAFKQFKKEYKYEEYEEIGTLIGYLYENKIDAIVLNDSYMELLDESNTEFKFEYREIYSYDILVETKSKVKVTDYTKDPFIIYISGSDSRYGINSVARSDVNILAVVNPKVNKVLLISIPRDYYVQLHDTYGLKDKLTHAGVYGVNKSITTIEDLLGIDINNYVKVCFGTVEGIVDAIDGIDIYSDTEFNAYTEGTRHLCHYIEGEQHINGECALRFARERKTYLTGDRHRGENQQEVIRAIITKLSNPKYLIRYDRVLSSINGTFETDIEYNDISEFAKYNLSNLKKWEVESISLDGTGAMEPTYSMGSNLPLYVMIPDYNSINVAKEKINEYLNY